MTKTDTPAAAVGLVDRGRIGVGARADLIRVSRLVASGALRGAWIAGRRL